MYNSTDHYLTLHVCGTVLRFIVLLIWSKFEKYKKKYKLDDIILN